MAAVTMYSLTEEQAVSALTDALHEIFAHRPKSFNVSFSASLYEAAEIHVEYDGIVDVITVNDPGVVRREIKEES